MREAVARDSRLARDVRASAWQSATCAGPSTRRAHLQEGSSLVHMVRRVWSSIANERVSGGVVSTSGGSSAFRTPRKPLPNGCPADANLPRAATSAASSRSAPRPNEAGLRAMQLAGGFVGVLGDMIEPVEHERLKLDEAVEDMESDAKEMQERSEELADRTEKVKSDWRAKEADDAVPGALPSPDDDE
jgi:hypothetical protein